MNELGVTVRYMRRYNLGSYQHEEIEISITGPYETIKNNVGLVADLSSTTTALGTLANTVFLQNRSNDQQTFGNPAKPVAPPTA